MVRFIIAATNRPSHRGREQPENAMGLKLTTAEVAGKNIVSKIGEKMKGNRPVLRTTPRKEMTADQWFTLSALQVVGEVLKVTATAIGAIRQEYDRPSHVDQEILKRALALLEKKSA